MPWASYTPSPAVDAPDSSTSPPRGRLRIIMGEGSSERLIGGREESPTERRGTTAKCLSMDTWKLLLCGQVVSLLTCGTGVFSQILSNNQVNIPTTQNFVNYVLLAAVYMSWMAYSNRASLATAFRERWWKYFLIALADVEANFVVVLAYRYTTITSIQLLDCATIPIVIALSFVILRTSYRPSHYLGAAICLGGLAFIVYADSAVQQVDSGGASNPTLGDGLCFIGAALYAISNVAEEYAVKNHSKTEFLAFVGLFGAVISGVQMAILEREQLASMSWSTDNVGLFLGFSVCLFLMYSLVPVFIGMSSATLMNLSLLTADVYSLLFGLFLFKLAFSPLYFAGFAVVLLGLVGYMWWPEGHRRSGDAATLLPRSATAYRALNSSSSLGDSDS